MANTGMKNTKLTGYTDGPLKVVPYRNANTYIKGCGKSFADAKEGRNPFHARTQNYDPEKITDHTGAKGAKGTSYEGRSHEIKDHTGAKPNTRGLEHQYRQDHKGKY